MRCMASDAPQQALARLPHLDAIYFYRVARVFELLEGMRLADEGFALAIQRVWRGVRVRRRAELRRLEPLALFDGRFGRRRMLMCGVLETY